MARESRQTKKQENLYALNREFRHALLEIIHAGKVYPLELRTGISEADLYALSLGGETQPKSPKEAKRIIEICYNLR